MLMVMPEPSKYHELTSAPCRSQPIFHVIDHFSMIKVQKLSVDVAAHPPEPHAKDVTLRPILGHATGVPSVRRCPWRCCSFCRRECVARGFRAISDSFDRDFNNMLGVKLGKKGEVSSESDVKLQRSVWARPILSGPFHPTHSPLGRQYAPRAAKFKSRAYSASCTDARI